MRRGAVHLRPLPTTRDCPPPPESAPSNPPETGLAASARGSASAPFLPTRMSDIEMLANACISTASPVPHLQHAARGSAASPALPTARRLPPPPRPAAPLSMLAPPCLGWRGEAGGPAGPRQVQRRRGGEGQAGVSPAAGRRSFPRGSGAARRRAGPARPRRVMRCSAPEPGFERLCVCVCVCVRARARVCVCSSHWA